MNYKFIIPINHELIIPINHEPDPTMMGSPWLKTAGDWFKLEGITNSSRGPRQLGPGGRHWGQVEWVNTGGGGTNKRSEWATALGLSI